ncbi:MAG: T9SS type A sorting domain-containing protein [Bacteroidia bacterium]
MNLNFNISLPLLLLITPFTKTIAQSVMPSNICFTANSLSNSSSSLDYTLGQIISTTLNTSQSCLTQGFLQPDYSVVSVSDVKKPNDIILYPNPATNNVFISTAADNAIKQVNVFSNEGKILYSGNENTVNVQDFPAGNYLFIVTTANSRLIAKIIKN